MMICKKETRRLLSLSLHLHDRPFSFHVLMPLFPLNQQIDLTALRAQQRRQKQNTLNGNLFQH